MNRLLLAHFLDFLASEQRLLLEGTRTPGAGEPVGLLTDIESIREKEIKQMMIGPGDLGPQHIADQFREAQLKQVRKEQQKRDWKKERKQKRKRGKL